MAISRRGFLGGFGAAVLLGACGADAPGDAGASADAPADTAYSPLLFFAPDIAVADGDDHRLPLGVADARAALTSDAPAEVAVRLGLDGDLGDPVTVTRHDTGVPIPYYPLVTSFASAGIYDLELTWQGGSAVGVLQALAPGESPLLPVGAALPAVPTPTVADPRGVEPICTRTPDVCPFHRRSLDEALAEGGPVALLVSTPAFCQTAVCGPVLDLLIDAAAGREDLTVIHAEVYADPYGENPPITTAPIMAELGMTFEPSLFVTDADGTLVTRLDNVFDATELAAALPA